VAWPSHAWCSDAMCCSSPGLTHRHRQMFGGVHRAVNTADSWSRQGSRLKAAAAGQEGTPVEGGEELQVPRRDQQAAVVGDGGRQALEQEALLAGLAAVEGDALRVLTDAHQTIPGSASSMSMAFQMA